MSDEQKAWELDSKPLVPQTSLPDPSSLQREKTRSRIAYSLLFILALALIVTLLKIDSFQDAKDLFSLLIGPIFTFLGYYAG